MSAAPKACECRFCGENFTAQGHENHERFCDENPNRGISYDQQAEMGLLDDEAEGTDGTGPNPTQETDSSGLPDVTNLSASKSASEGGESGKQAATDGGVAESCPLCDSEEVLPASDAKAYYIEEVEKPSGKAVLGYELAEQSCQNPKCGALWGGKFSEAFTMEEVLNA